MDKAILRKGYSAGTQGKSVRFWGEHKCREHFPSPSDSRNSTTNSIWDEKAYAQIMLLIFSFFSEGLGVLHMHKQNPRLCRINGPLMPAHQAHLAYIS